MKVRFSKNCLAQLSQIAQYIVEELKMPETAEKFIDRMYNFSVGLSKNHVAYKICKYPQWAVLGYKCAAFEKKWVFAFSNTKNIIIVEEITLGKLLNY